MTKKQTITESVTSLDLCGDVNCVLVSLQNMRDKALGNGYRNLRVEHDDEDGGYLYLVGTRDETEIEVKQRLAARKRDRARRQKEKAAQQNRAQQQLRKTVSQFTREEVLAAWEEGKKA